MPDQGQVLISPTGERKFFYDEDISAAVQAGWAPESATRAQSTLTDTQALLQPQEYTQAQANAGLTGTDPAAEAAAFEEAQRAARYQGLGQQVLGGIEGAASVASLSASDWLLEGLGADTAERAKYTAGRTVGEIGAGIGLALTPFGKGKVAQAITKFTPGGMVSKAGSGGGSALARVARTAGEGAAYGVAQASTNVALAEPGLSAEAVWSELGQGAVLGLALGGTAGAVGEGVSWAGKTFTAARANRAVRGIDFDSGSAKEALNDMARAHAAADDAVRLAAAQRATSRDAIVADLEATRVANLAKDAEDIHARIAAVGMPDPAGVEALTAARARIAADLAEGKISKAGLLDLEAAHNALAMARGGTGALPPNAVRDAILSAGSTKGKSITDLIDAGDVLLTRQGPDTARLDKLLQKAQASGKAKDLLRYHTAAAQAAEAAGKPELKALSEQAVAKFTDDAATIANYVKSVPKTTHDAAAAKSVLGLHPEQKITPETFKRLLSKPEELATKALELNKYYAKALEDVADNPISLAQVTDAAKAYQQALDKLAAPEAQEFLTAKTVMAALGVEFAAEAYDGPGKSLLQLAALTKLSQGLAGSRGKSSLGNRLVRAFARRGAAAAGFTAAGAVAPGGIMGSIVRSVGGSAGFQAATSVMGRGGSKAAIDATMSLKDVTKAAAQRVTTGKPRRARAMPLLNTVLDKMLGGPPEAKNTKPVEKFKLLQDRLAKYNAAPDAVMNGVYQVLQPMQDVSAELADHMETTLDRQLAHAYETMPKDPGTMVYSGVSRWQPTDRQLREWGFSLMGIAFPGVVVDAIADGTCPPQAAQALAVANPEVYADFQRHLLENANEVRENATYNQRIALGLAFQVPLDPTTDPRYVAFMQASHAQQTMEQSAGAAGDPKDPEQELTDAQKLLS